MKEGADLLWKWEEHFLKTKIIEVLKKWGIINREQENMHGKQNKTKNKKLRGHLGYFADTPVLQTGSWFSAQ